MTHLIQRILQNRILPSQFLPSQFLRLALFTLVLIAFQATPASAQTPPWTTADGSGNINNTNSGKVGIGTTGPLSPLHVGTGSTAAAGELGSFLVTGGSTAKRLAMGVDSSGTMHSWLQSVENGVVQRALALNPAGGNVGVGTTAPSDGLHIRGTPTTISGSYNSLLRIQNSAAGASGNQAGINFSTNSAGSGNAFILAREGASSAGSLLFGGYSGSAFVESMRIVNSSGDVGIGTTNPD